MVIKFDSLARMFDRTFTSEDDIKGLSGESSLGRHPDFQPTAETGHAVSARPVDDRDEEIHLERTEFPLADGLGRFGQIHHPDDRRQGSVFEEDNELGHQGRGDISNGLWKNDASHGLDIIQTCGSCCVDLPLRHRLDTRPHDLSDIGAFENNEGRQSDPILGHGATDDHRDEKPEPEDDHDKWDPSYQFNVDGRGVMNPRAPC